MLKENIIPHTILKYSKELSEVEAVVQKECEAAYKKQIEEVAEQYGISVKKVTFRWDSAKEHIRKLEIEGSLKTLQNEKYKKSEKQIGSVQTETVEKIKKIMMQLYNLKKSDIQIEVE